MAGNNRDPDAPFLTPVEHPSGVGMRMAYYFTRRQFGKVITPLKVHSARLPTSFGRFYTRVSSLDRQLTLPAETALLIRERVARINVCLFCIDMDRAYTIMSSMDQAKFDALDEYGASPLFSAAERAALDYATQLTRDRKVDPATFDRLAEHYSERQICEIVYLVASEHLYNITNIGLNIRSDMICDIARRRKAEDGRT